MIFCCACGRNCIITVNRPLDVLGKNLQPAVAHNLGYGDRSPSKRIEKFMRDLYTHMRNIFLITRTLEQRMALVRRRKAGSHSLRAAALPTQTRTGDRWTASSSSTAKSTPRPTASSAIRRAGSCAFFCTRSSGT